MLARRGLIRLTGRTLGSSMVAALSCLPIAASADRICDNQTLLNLIDRPTTALSSCVLTKGGAVLESGYYQNASSVGGSEVARYPNAALRLGITSKLELDVEGPSQVDVSGNHGRGFWSLTDPGVGMKWQLANRAMSAYDLDAQIEPQPQAASYPWQPRFALQFDSTQLIERRLRTILALGVVDDRRIARKQADFPGLRSSTGLSYLTSPASEFSVEVNVQSSVARAIRGQSYGDATFRQALNRHVAIDVEGGQTFNAAAKRRPHYIGAGLALGATRH
jgi:hypothetical protein